MFPGWLGVEDRKRTRSYWPSFYKTEVSAREQLNAGIHQWSLLGEEGEGKVSSNHIHIPRNRVQVTPKRTWELAGCFVRSDLLCHMFPKWGMILAHITKTTVVWNASGSSGYQMPTAGLPLHPCSYLASVSYLRLNHLLVKWNWGTVDKYILAPDL